MAAGGGGLEQLMTAQMVQAAKVVEERLDEEMDRLDNMNDEELDKIKRERVMAMKRQKEKRQEWIKNGHGEYEEIPEEKDFFEVSKKSDGVVCHFYTDGNERCKIVDKHLGILAKRHLEAKFVKINAEKCPFLTERLKIRVIPTIMLVKDSKTRDYIVGFTDLGNHDEFSTEMMEWRIATAGVIEYSGDLMTPPDAAKGASKKKTTILGKGMKAKTIRQGGKGNRDDDDSSDDDDW